MKTIKFLKKYITASRNSYALELKHDSKYWSLSALTYGYYRDIFTLVNSRNFGDLLDAGAGGLNGKELFTNHCKSYTSLDITDRIGEIDIIGDIQNMVAVQDNTYDTVYSSQVLEHIPYPAKALKEFQRVLKIDGICIISVPHISHYHEIPHDYFRFTEFGISRLLCDAGFTIEEIKKQNGIISFLTHPLSILMMSIFWKIQFVKWIAFYINKIFLVLPSFYLDKALHMTKIYPVNILVIAKLTSKNKK